MMRKMDSAEKLQVGDLVYYYATVYTVVSVGESTVDIYDGELTLTVKINNIKPIYG